MLWVTPVNFILFMFGAALGSFLNVISLRYDPEKFLVSSRVLGGRSRCSACGRTLRWFELIPIVSFVLQAGRCRTCRSALRFQYLAVEILAGLVVLLVPRAIASPYLAPWLFILTSAIWITALLILLLISLIDIRLTLIPDEANISLALLGVALILTRYLGGTDVTLGSFTGSYGLLLTVTSNVFVHHVLGALGAVLFFGFLVFATRGRGMGLGDVKLAGAVGLLFGWSDMLLIIALAFVAGSLAGGGTILAGRKTIKDFLPFGPFLALGAAVTFFFGFEIVDAYFKLFTL